MFEVSVCTILNFLDKERNAILFFLTNDLTVLYTIIGYAASKFTYNEGEKKKKKKPYSNSRQESYHYYTFNKNKKKKNSFFFKLHVLSQFHIHSSKWFHTKEYRKKKIL